MEASPRSSLGADQVMEVVILPEMTIAGTEALLESRKQGLDEEQTALAVYMAMRAVYLIAVLPRETAH